MQHSKRIGNENFQLRFLLAHEREGLDTVLAQEPHVRNVPLQNDWEISLVLTQSGGL